MNFEEMVQRIVNAKAKTGLKSSIIVRDLDVHCSSGYRFSHSPLAKIQTQVFNTKKSKAKESRPKKSKLAKDKTPTLPWSKSTEPRKTSCIDKRREYLEKKQDQKNNTPATEDNANAIEGVKKKQNN